MALKRIVLSIIAPPLSVLDHDLNTIIIVAFFTALGWVPGVMVALGIHFSDWYTARQDAKQAATLSAMQAHVQSGEQFVNVPDAHRSGPERLDKAVRGQAIVQEQQEQANPTRR